MKGAKYHLVASRVGQLIDRGTLRPGDRVPSLRRTSRHEGVSLATSLQAYSLLESRGYIEARPQSGFFVRPRAGTAVAEPHASAPGRAAARVDVAALAARVLESAQDRRLVPFGAACPSPDLLPTRKLARLVASLARTAGGETNAYSFPPGRLELRREIARRAVDWGGRMSPDDVLITSGATNALALALRATAEPGATVGVESPTYFGTLLLLETLGLKAVEITTDPRTGLQVDDLARVLSRHRLAAVVASPTCQNPLGSVMPDEAKRQLVALLTRHDVPLIEDDVYGDAFHGDERPRPAKAWDRAGIVLLCSSFCKLLAPGYRVGWVAGGRYQASLVRLQLATTLANAALPQMALAAYLRSGAYDQFLRRIRRVYREQTNRAREAVARSFPRGTTVTSPAGGFLLWVEMPPAVDGLDLTEKALAEGISISPGPLFSARRQQRHCIRLSCGEPWSRALDDALATVGAIASRLSA